MALNSNKPGMLGPTPTEGTRKENNIRAFIKSHPILTYYALVFAISWGGFLLVGAPGLFAGTNWQTDPLFPLAVLAMLAGPPIAGLLLTSFVSGKAGFRQLLSRLLRWRVAVRWYIVALLTAPILMTAILFALSLFSPEFLPAIVTTQTTRRLSCCSASWWGLGAGSWRS